MTTFKMNGVVMVMEDGKFCDMMVQLCKSAMNENKVWKEYLKEIGFELVEVEVR